MGPKEEDANTDSLLKYIVPGIMYETIENVLPNYSIFKNI